MFCKKCGTELEKDWKTCPNCGEKIENVNKDIPRNKKPKIGKIIIGIIEILLAIMVIKVVAEMVVTGKSQEELKKEYSGQYNPDDKDELTSDLSIQVSDTVNVDREELARNANKYDGKAICLSTSFTILSDEIVAIGENGYIPTGWAANKPVSDEQGNEAGNLIMGDEGYVIGIYHSEDNSIDAVHIIIYSSGNSAAFADETSVEATTDNGTGVTEEKNDDIPITEIPAEDRTKVLGKGWQHAFVLPYSDCEYVTEEELEELNSDLLRIARNEIYARHGRKFNDPDLQKYFEEFGWYEGTIEPDDFDDGCLNAIEKSNIETISAWENEVK